MAAVEPGHTYLWGQDKALAVALLAAADTLGYDQSQAVRTADGGFVVPDDVADLALANLDTSDGADHSTGNEF